MRCNTPADFWRHVDKRGPNDCWLWLGAPIKNTGYGRFRIGGVYHLAHRYSYELHHGKIPADGPQLVCHTCDVKLCVNTAHHWLGTTEENQADKVAKGRQAQGERHGRAKLTKGQVASIRNDFTDGASKRGLARKYNVHATQIGRIVNNEAWT